MYMLIYTYIYIYIYISTKILAGCEPTSCMITNGYILYRISVVQRACIDEFMLGVYNNNNNNNNNGYDCTNTSHVLITITILLITVAILNNNTNNRNTIDPIIQSE